MDTRPATWRKETVSSEVGKESPEKQEVQTKVRDQWRFHKEDDVIDSAMTSQNRKKPYSPEKLIN